jgi:hypothetical protein
VRTAVLCFFLLLLNISVPAGHAQGAVQAHLPQLTPWVTAPGDLAAHSTANGGMEMQVLPSGIALPDMSPQAPPLGSTYVPMDNWMYPALDRLQALGYIDTAFLLVNSRHIRGGFCLARLRRSADTTPNSSERLRQIILKATVLPQL